MSCSSFDLKGYFLGELPEPDRRQVESHLAACTPCRDELGALDFTRAALLSVADEEPPRRIAFVSDKVFEPRWWQRLWNSGPRLVFAASAVLATAIVAHGYLVRPSAPAVQATASTSAIEAEVRKRLAVEVANAVAASEQRQMARTVELVSAKLRDAKTEQRENLLMIRDYLEWIQKKDSARISRTAYDQ